MGRAPAGGSASHGTVAAPVPSPAPRHLVSPFPFPFPFAREEEEAEGLFTTATHDGYVDARVGKGSQGRGEGGFSCCWGDREVGGVTERSSTRRPRPADALSDPWDPSSATSPTVGGAGSPAILPSRAVGVTLSSESRSGGYFLPLTGGVGLSPTAGFKGRHVSAP